MNQAPFVPPPPNSPASFTQSAAGAPSAFGFAASMVARPSARRPAMAACRLRLGLGRVHGRPGRPPGVQRVERRPPRHRPADLTRRRAAADLPAAGETEIARTYQPRIARYPDWIIVAVRSRGNHMD